MTRYGFVLGLNAAKKAEYIRLHEAVWPDVLRMIKSCHIANYAIFLKEPENLMFAYYEYHGQDHGADMARMAADPVTQDWWALCMPCQTPLATRKEGEWWAGMRQVFHTD